MAALGEFQVSHIDAHRRAGRDNDGALDHILQFSYVSRPVISAQGILGGEGIVSMAFFMCLENCCVKCRTRSGISPWRSRKGGTWTGKTFNRKKRSDRNFCSLTITSKSRFVAAIK